MGVMGYRGYGIQETWGLWGTGVMEYRRYGDYGVQGDMGVMGYRGLWGLWGYGVHVAPGVSLGTKRGFCLGQTGSMGTKNILIWAEETLWAPKRARIGQKRVWEPKRIFIWGQGDLGFWGELGGFGEQWRIRVPLPVSPAPVNKRPLFFPLTPSFRGVPRFRGGGVGVVRPGLP